MKTCEWVQEYDRDRNPRKICGESLSIVRIESRLPYCDNCFRRGNR